MSRQTWAIGLFLFGLGAGLTASAGGPRPDDDVIQCQRACMAQGNSHAYCYQCCVYHVCPDPL
jgi:hypothetical protein